MLGAAFFEGVGEAFVKKDPKSAASIAVIDRVVEFAHRERDRPSSASLTACERMRLLSGRGVSGTAAAAFAPQGKRGRKTTVGNSDT
jgi:hypothetical protein